MFSRKALLALCVGLIFPASTFAGGVSYTNSSLKGAYVINLHGTAIDDNGDIGGLSLNGVVGFNGNGTLNNANWTVTYGDSAHEQYSCNSSSSSGDIDLDDSVYNVFSNGQGEMFVEFESFAGNDCWQSDGGLAIDFTLPRSTGGTTRLVVGGGNSLGDSFLDFDTTVGGVFFAEEEIETLTLTGSMYLQNSGLGG